VYGSGEKPPCPPLGAPRPVIDGRPPACGRARGGPD
jgi:hypothetical protein